MRRVKGPAALLAMALLGGCASAPPPEAVAGARAARTQAVACTTTDLFLATVSKCGAGGFALGVAAE